MHYIIDSLYFNLFLATLAAIRGESGSTSQINKQAGSDFLRPLAGLLRLLWALAGLLEPSESHFQFQFQTRSDCRFTYLWMCVCVCVCVYIQEWIPRK